MKMKPYRRLSGDSGVLAWAAEPKGIRVRFVDGTEYTYTHASAGRAHVEIMKRLAEEGQGLSGYISKFVRERYASKR